MWWLRIIALNAVAGVGDVLYAVEGAYFVPAIYDKGLSSFYGSMILCISPMLSILFQGYLGSASDQCKCSWGRRRPFILALTICGICGLVLFPFTENIADLLKNGNLEHARYSVLLILTVIATALTDFCAGNIIVPGRAYLIDVLPEEYTKSGNIICSVWISAGATIGFAIGVITWSSNFKVQVTIVCGISLIMTIVGVTLTLFSVDENNPQTKRAVKTGQASNEENNKIIQQSTTKYQADASELKDNEKTSLSTGYSQNPQNDSHDDTVTDVQTGCGCKCCNDFVSSILGNLHFIRCMSVPMMILCFVMFFGCFAFFTQLFFFTDYVGDVVYNGDITAPEDSPEYDDYTEGVRVGSLALGISAASSLLFSFMAGPLMKLFGMKLVLVSSLVLSMLQSGVMIVCHNLIVVFALLPAMYCLLTILLLILFILVSEYAAKSMLLRKYLPFADANLTGRACSILIIFLLFSEVVALLINGPLQSLYGSAESIMILSCASSFVGAVIACFVKIPTEDTKENTEVGIDDDKTVAEVTESTRLLIN